MEGVARRRHHDELGELVAEQLGTAGAIILGRRRHGSWAEAWPEPELCSGHAIEPRSPSSPKYPVEGPVAHNTFKHSEAGWPAAVPGSTCRMTESTPRPVLDVLDRLNARAILRDSALNPGSTGPAASVTV